jgi:hypothetical protein
MEKGHKVVWAKVRKAVFDVVRALMPISVAENSTQVLSL